MRLIKEAREKEFVLMRYRAIKVLDSNHAVARFIQRNKDKDLTLQDLFDTIRKGVKEIYDRGLELGNYMIVCDRLDVRIPITLSKGFESKELKFSIPTVLEGWMVKNKFNELELMIEKNMYQLEEVIDGYRIYLDDDEIFTTWEDVEIK